MNGTEKGDDLASQDLFDSCFVLAFERFLVQRAGAPHVLSLTSADQGPLRRSVDIAEHADDHRAFAKALCRSRTAAKVLAMHGDHRVGELGQLSPTL